MKDKNVTKEELAYLLHSLIDYIKDATSEKYKGQFRHEDELWIMHQKIHDILEK